MASRILDQPWASVLRARGSRRRVGFTLIELLVAISIALVLIYALYVMFNQASRITTTADTALQVSQNARSIFQFIERQVVGAYVSHPYQLYMWAQDLTTAPDDPDRRRGTGAALTNLDDRTGRLVQQGRAPALYWENDALAGLFVRESQSNQVRLIRTNGPYYMNVDPGWDLSGQSMTADFVMPRNMDSLLFFTASASELDTGVENESATQALVLLTVDDPTVRGQPPGPAQSARALPPRLIAFIAPRSSQSGKFEPLRTPAGEPIRPVEVGRFVTDLNVEYAERVWDEANDRYLLRYRQCNEPSVGEISPNHPWAVYPIEFSDNKDMLHRDLKDQIFPYYFNDGSNALRFHELPSALRVTIRVTDSSRRIARCFSQVMRIQGGLINR